MNCLGFKAASSNEPEEEEVDINAIPWDFTSWFRLWKDGRDRSIGETSNARGSGASTSAGDDGNQSSAIEQIPSVETEIVPRISEDEHIRTEIVPRIISVEQWSLYKSLSDKMSTMKGIAFYVDSPPLMRAFVAALAILDDPQISNRNTPMLYPARSHYITNGDVADDASLEKRMEDFVRSIALDFKNIVEAESKIHLDLMKYINLLLKSHYGNAAQGRIILPLQTESHGRVAIWINPSLTTLLEKRFGYQFMPPYSDKFQMVLGPRICVIDPCDKWMQNAINMFNRLRCKVLALENFGQAMDIMRLRLVCDSMPNVFKLDMVVMEYHPTRPEISELPDGFRLLCHMKASERWRNTPFIMTLSYNDPRAIKESLEAGADMVIIKPWLDYEDVEELEYLIRTVLYYKMHKNWSNI